ncbi:MAG: hypothetical protein R3F20_15545 [Planctomycetota bacterium]
MNRGMGRLFLLIGTVAYAAIAVLALLTFMKHVAIFSLATLGIAIQVALALPLIAFLFAGRSMPVLPYARWMAGLVSVLAIAGLLGVPTGTSEARDPQLAIEAAKAGVGEDMNARKILDLKVDLAGADKDDRKDIEKKIEEAQKEISDKDKEELQREMAVLEAKEDLARFDSAARGSSLRDAERRNALLVIAAFLVLAGAWMMDRDGKPAA